MKTRDKTHYPLDRLRRLIIGKPIPSSEAHHQRLSPFFGLPVFSSDALSSVAYATEAILGILVLWGLNHLNEQLYISAAIALLIVIVALSYQQTIYAYPLGGGSYSVASENLGETAGLIAGASLMIDYVLTVAVSTAAGIAAVVSAVPALHRFLVPMAVACIFGVAWANLRGMKESGAVFAIPTYSFVVSMVILVGVAFFKTVGHPLPHQGAAPPEIIGKEMHVAAWFLILRAFAAGCTALTGIEAVSNGVQAFRVPESKNAAMTLRWMAAILVILFCGIGYCVRYLPQLTFYEAKDDRYQTIISQIAQWAFGHGTLMYYVLQGATALILVLAANTAFADFPRLGSFLSRDGFLPRYLARQGDRLVFHNGIVLLAAVAGMLVWYFRGELDALLPLYAVGVFTAFTLSQTGMVFHWFRLKEGNWRRSAAINTVGAVMSGLVTLIILVTKFAEGAWMVLVLLIILFFLFKMIKSRYRSISRQLEITSEPVTIPSTHTSLLLVPRVHKGVIQALEYALLLDPKCRAVHVAIDKRKLSEVKENWDRYGEGVPLVVLNTPFRSLIRPVLDYIDDLMAKNPDQIITVIVPEAVSSKLIHKILQENVAQQLRSSLQSRKNVLVTNVRYFLD